jgi:hypothetical protein
MSGKLGGDDTDEVNLTAPLAIKGAKSAKIEAVPILSTHKIPNGMRWDADPGKWSFDFVSFMCFVAVLPLFKGILEKAIDHWHGLPEISFF